MPGYDPNSCSSLQKSYYHAIEVALRWCGLTDYETEILETLGVEDLPSVSMFPSWPCLRINCEKMLDAIENKELAHGRDGKIVPEGEHVAVHRRTVRHNDLRAWMQKHYPGQKPPFLFDQVERGTHQAINADSFRALQADLSAYEARIEKAKEAWLSQNGELKKAREEIKKLKSLNGNETLHPRRRSSYLTLLEGLVLDVLDEKVLYQPYKAAGILQTIIERHGRKMDKDPVADIIKEIIAIREERSSGTS